MSTRVAVPNALQSGGAQNPFPLFATDQKQITSPQSGSRYGTGNVITTVTRLRRETVLQSAQGGILWLLLLCVWRLCGRCSFHVVFFLRCIFRAPEALGLFIISWCNGRRRRSPSLRVYFVLNAGSRQMERTCGILGIWQQKKKQVLFEYTVDGEVVGTRG